MPFGRGTEGCHENGPVATITAPVLVTPEPPAHSNLPHSQNLQAAHT